MPTERDHSLYWRLTMCALMIGVVVGVVLSAVLVASYVGVSDYRRKCENFAHATGREVHFEAHMFAPSLCVSRASDGKMLPVEQLR